MLTYTFWSSYVLGFAISYSLFVIQFAILFLIDNLKNKIINKYCKDCRDSKDRVVHKDRVVRNMDKAIMIMLIN